MTTRACGTNRSECAATFDAVWHWAKGAFFGGFVDLPATMIIAETIDVRLAGGIARARSEVARTSAGTMRVGITFHAGVAIAQRGRWAARGHATTGIAGVHRLVARATIALRIIGTAHAFGRGSRLPLAIRRISAARVATHAAAFVFRTRRAHAAQAKRPVAAIGILTAFGTRRSDWARQTERETRLRRPVDHDGFDRKAIDAGITATRRDVVFRQLARATTHGQVANSTATFGIGRAFDTQRIAPRLDRRTLHLHAELPIGTAVAGSSRARIGRVARLAIFAVANFAFLTIRILIAFVARLRGRIAGESRTAILVGPTPSAFESAIEVHAERRISPARRTGGTTKLVRIARSAKRCIVAIIAIIAFIVARQVDVLPVALLANVQARVRRIAAQRLEKRRRWKQRESRFVELHDRRLVRRTLEVHESTNEIRHLQRRVLAYLHVKNLERVQASLLKCHLLRQTPDGKTHLRRTRDNQILSRIRAEKCQTYGVVRVKPEMNGLVCQVRRDVEITAQPRCE